ncbi:sulfur carrier protein ThiS [Alteromonas ponticola]|uniref:Sulfur carrier protein ThiS n=1 Tax=Alteromonas ponticola TaxID=2720613 RepID=A0ABX1R058_9ALTE|nr:sulfur carrier protein ThiS [Alteromonas ponticola]NMH59849.1 sulfur carrier protein ThiS [Alteromonas ponticola]
MTITVNGKLLDFAEHINVVSLLKYLKIKPTGVAVAINNQIIFKDDWLSASLNDNDNVDVFQVVAGG